MVYDWIGEVHHRSLPTGMAPWVPLLISVAVESLRAPSPLLLVCNSKWNGFHGSDTGLLPYLRLHLLDVEQIANHQPWVFKVGWVSVKQTIRRLELQPVAPTASDFSAAYLLVVHYLPDLWYLHHRWRVLLYWKPSLHCNSYGLYQVLAFYTLWILSCLWIARGESGQVCRKHEEC